MGLFHLFKTKKTSSKPKQSHISYEYHGYENLPDDFDILEKMFDYYNGLYKKNDFEGYEEERFMIAKRFKEAGDKQIPYNPINRGRFIYTLYFGTIEEKAAYCFDEFIEKSRKTLIPVTILKQRKNKKMIIDEYLYQASFSSSLENRFTFHDKEDLSEEEKEDNALVEYYENHLNQLVDVIFELIDKQKQGGMLLYTGYFMYIDLYHFFVKEEQRFSKQVWDRSHVYNTHCSAYYDSYLLFKLEHCKKSYDIIQRKNQIALDNMHTCDREMLKLLSENYLPARNVMNLINRYVYKHKLNLTENEIKKLLSQIKDLSTDVCLTIVQRNKIASFLYSLATLTHDLKVVDEICFYLKDIDKNGINVPKYETNNISKIIRQIEVRKRELYAEINNLPTFNIIPLEMEFMGKTGSNMRYYDMKDGRQLIVTNVFAHLQSFKEGDILESIQTGERFELLSIRLKPKGLFEIYEDETDETLPPELEVQIAYNGKYRFDERETLVKIL